MAHPSLTKKRQNVSVSNSTIRYKGFLLIEQENKSWLIRPERSPLVLLPFRTPSCSLRKAQQILDNKLTQENLSTKAA